MPPALFAALSYPFMRLGHFLFPTPWANCIIAGAFTYCGCLLNLIVLFPYRTHRRVLRLHALCFAPHKTSGLPEGGEEVPPRAPLQKLRVGLRRYEYVSDARPRVLHAELTFGPQANSGTWSSTRSFRFRHLVYIALHYILAYLCNTRPCFHCFRDEWGCGACRPRELAIATSTVFFCRKAPDITFTPSPPSLYLRVHLRAVSLT
jgi:hypothetical protein